MIRQFKIENICKFSIEKNIIFYHPLFNPPTAVSPLAVTVLNLICLAMTVWLPILMDDRCFLHPFYYHNEGKNVKAETSKALFIFRQEFRSNAVQKVFIGQKVVTRRLYLMEKTNFSSENKYVYVYYTCVGMHTWRYIIWFLSYGTIMEKMRNENWSRRTSHVLLLNLFGSVGRSWCSQSNLNKGW